MGGLKEEKALLSALGKEKEKNQVFFLLSLANDFKRISEDENTHSLWTSNEKKVASAKNIINLTLNRLKKEDKVFNLEELFRVQKPALSGMNKDVFNSCIGISKKGLFSIPTNIRKSNLGSSSEAVFR